MKFRIISDIHSDYYQGLQFGDVLQPTLEKLIENLNSLYPEIDKDEILIVAGDLGVLMTYKKEISDIYIQILKYLKSRWNQVILVPGNHEYYYGSIPEVNFRLKSICEELNIHYLQKNTLELDGYTFVGCVLWSDLSYNDWININSKMKRLFKNYKNHKQEFVDNLKWLTATLKNYRSRDNVIVITHYPPIRDLIHTKILENDRTRLSSMANDLDKIIINNQLKPKLWICGHSHETVKLEKFGIQFYLNPLGGYFENRNSPVTNELLII